MGDGADTSSRFFGLPAWTMRHQLHQQPPQLQQHHLQQQQQQQQQQEQQLQDQRQQEQQQQQVAIKCCVCELAASGNNFGVATCESCKTFFRRNAKREPSQIKCLHQNNCNILREYRRSCTACRLRKCFAVGMKKDLILSDEKLKTRARPTFKKPRFRWCRVPADVNVDQLLSGIGATGPNLHGSAMRRGIPRMTGGGNGDLSAEQFMPPLRMFQHPLGSQQYHHLHDPEATNAAATAAAVAAVAAANAASSRQLPPPPFPPLPRALPSQVEFPAGVGGGAAAAAAAAVAAAAAGAFDDSSTSDLDESRAASLTEIESLAHNFELSLVYQQLLLCVKNYQQPYESRGPCVSSKLFNPEEGFSTLESSVRKMIRLIPQLPGFENMEKNLLGRIVKFKVFGGIQLASVLSYDYSRDAWVLLLDNPSQSGGANNGGVANGNLEEVVLETKAATMVTFMGLMTRRCVDGRPLYSAADVERIYETLRNYYCEIRALFGEQRQVAALILLGLYLLEDDVGLELSDAEKALVKATQWHYMQYLDGLANMQEAVPAAANYKAKRALLLLLPIRWLDVRYSDGSKVMQITAAPPIMQELEAT